MYFPIVNYVISPFEGNINPGDPQELKLYIQATQEIDNEADKLDISVSNAKGVIDQFLIISNKYGWVRLAFMVETGEGPNKLFRQVEQIHIADIHYQDHEYFVLVVVGNVGNNVLPDPLVVSDLQNLAGDPQQIKQSYDRVCPDIIPKTIYDSITKIYINILRLH